VGFDAYDAKAAKNATSNNHRDAVLRVLGESAVPMYQSEVVELLKMQGHSIDNNLQKPTFEGLAFDNLIVKNAGKWMLHQNDQMSDDFDD
jgi:hypothetical protein